MFLMLPWWRLQGPCFLHWKHGPSLSAEFTRARSPSEAGPEPVMPPSRMRPRAEATRTTRFRQR
jgi:hypothetical protein